MICSNDFGIVNPIHVVKQLLETPKHGLPFVFVNHASFWQQ